VSMIYTRKERCRGCYACVRGCPCKAIKVENQRAEVKPELCVDCGACIRVCTSKAKMIESDVGLVHEYLASGLPVIAVPAAAFPAAFPEISPGQMVSALKRLGFSEVLEEAFGAEMISREYVEILKERSDSPIFSSACPAVVSYIEKFHPELIDRLAPIVSPMIAMGRLIKQVYRPDAKVVFISPCVARKAESKDKNVAGVIDAVLTFAELKEMLAEKGIDPDIEPDSKFDGPKPYLGRLFAISGGLLEAAGLKDDILHNQFINAHGRDYVIRYLEDIAKGEIHSRFINFVFCHGCINGPTIDNDRSIFIRRELVARYVKTDSDPEQTLRDLEKYRDVDLRRGFTAQDSRLPVPAEEEIQEILRRMNREKRADQFDCGACGYRTCRELAIAVAQNQAEINMCWPHLLSELKDTQQGLIQAEKLSSLGQLSASIAHEINNPLSGVLVYTQLLSKKISNDNVNKEAALTYLRKMEVELTRSTKLVRNLLDFSRQSPPALKETDVNEVINRALDLVSHSAQTLHIKVARELDLSLPRIMADPDQLQQVGVNLILNAIQAMPDGGKLTLRTSREDSYIKIEVQDTGCGIPPENMSKLFTPFFTTKKEVKGVGLGLAVSYGIIQRHHGRITVKSKEGEGSTFTIYLPAGYEEKN